MGFTLNLTADEIKNAQGNNFEALPAGIYGATIFEVSESQSKAGNDMYVIDFKIEEGQAGIGRKQRGWFVVSGKALFNVVNLLKALDLPYPDKDTEPGEFSFPDGDTFLGEKVLIQLKKEPYKTEVDGKVVDAFRNNVAKVLGYDEDKIDLAEDADAPSSGSFL